MPTYKMPRTSKKRALQLGAAFIQADLDKMRDDMTRLEERARDNNVEPLPLTSSHEADLMKAAEWATAVTWLTAMAEAEGS